MVALLAAAGVALLAALAEVLHFRRTRRLATLAFGPSRHPAPWAYAAPWLRALSLAALAWGLTTLLLLPPKAHTSEAIPESELKHLVLVLDVSPSMRLADAGPEKKLSRRKRAADLLQSFFTRVPMDRYRTTAIATYNGAKPVVLDTKDREIIRNIMDDLPLEYAFVSGNTDLFSGLGEAATIAKPWNPRSTILLVISDGDTVPPTGIPKMPASVSDVLIVGVGDPRVGSFIAGRQSRQDVSTLRQMAVRLNGTYHDGNEKHIPTDLLLRMAGIAESSPFDKLSEREYALIACGVGATVYALLPLLLHAFGTRWRPGVPAQQQARGARTGVPDRMLVG